MGYQEIITSLILIIIVAFLILLILITKNIMQHRKIYSFRTDDKVWDHWKSQVFGLILFIFGFMSFTICFFGYIFISHPEFFGFGITWIIITQDPLENVGYIINAFLGLGVSIAGMILSIRSIGQFIKNIEQTKGGKS